MPRHSRSRWRPTPIATILWFLLAAMLFGVVGWLVLHALFGISPG